MQSLWAYPVLDVANHLLGQFEYLRVRVRGQQQQGSPDGGVDVVEGQSDVRGGACKRGAWRAAPQSWQLTPTKCGVIGVKAGGGGRSVET